MTIYDQESYWNMRFEEISKKSKKDMTEHEELVYLEISDFGTDTENLRDPDVSFI